MNEEEIKTMVNNAFKRFSKELEENPDNVFNYLELQEKYNSVLKTKVKLQQENKKYKEVINKALKLNEKIINMRYQGFSYEQYKPYLLRQQNILKEVEHE